MSLFGGSFYGFASSEMVMLLLDQLSIVVTKTVPEGNRFSIHVGYEGRPAACITCGSQNFIGHGQHVQEVMDLSHQGKLTCIHHRRRRSGLSATSGHQSTLLGEEP